MTVRELIDQLEKEPPDMIVVVDGYEGGYDDPVMGKKTVILDSNYDGENKPVCWRGQHEPVEKNNLAAREVVVIGRWH